MSKNKVWNRGKHNGAGLSKKSNPVQDSSNPAGTDVRAEEPPNPRIDTVKPMNRSNWVVRPSRVAPKETDNKH